MEGILDDEIEQKLFKLADMACDNPNVGDIQDELITYSLWLIERCAEIADSQAAHAEICFIGGIRDAKVGKETAEAIALTIRAFGRAEEIIID